MKRNIIVEKLIKEGLSETTLVKLNDKQLGQLAERMLGEDLTTTAAAMQKSPEIQQMAKTPGQNIKLVGEDLKGNQKKIDKNHNGKIDADDFKILNKEKHQQPKETKEGNKFSGELAKAKEQHKDSFDVDGKKYDVKEADMGLTIKSTPKKKEVEEVKPSAGLSKEKKSEVVKKAKKGEDIGKKGKGFEKIADKAAKKYGSKEKGEKVAAASMWKNVKREGVEVKEWVNNLAENNLYHSFTSKNEIMELIQTKLNESATMTHQFGPKVKKGHNGIPEFMSYDAITSSGPATAPTKPKPTTKPGTNPGTKPKTPYQPGPGPNHKPKALGLSERKSGPATAPTKPKPTTKPGTKPKKDNPYSPKPGPNHKPKALGEKKVK